MTAAADGPHKTVALPRLLMACSTVADGSGMMTAVAPLARHLAQQGLDVTLLGPLAEGDRAVAANGAGSSRVIVLPRSRGWPRPLVDGWQTAIAVAGFSAAGARRFVHVHGVWTAANAAACVRCRTLGLPYVVSPHGMLLPAAMRRSAARKRWAVRTFVRANLTHAAAVHVSSEAEREAVLAIAPTARTCLIPWGVDIPAVSRSLETGTRTRQAAFIGRIIPLKGIGDVVGAWAAVQPERWELRLIGPDPEGYAKRIAADVEARGLTHCVTIESPVPHQDLMDRLRQLDLLILPSYSENFGMIVAEALAAGVPVITTTATPWQQLEARGCGWCVPPGSTPLAAALQAACHCSPKKLQFMGQNGRAWMEADFSWTHVADQFLGRLYGFRA